MILWGFWEKGFKYLSFGLKIKNKAYLLLKSSDLTGFNVSWYMIYCLLQPLLRFQVFSFALKHFISCIAAMFSLQKGEKNFFPVLGYKVQPSQDNAVNWTNRKNTEFWFVFVCKLAYKHGATSRLYSCNMLFFPPDTGWLWPVPLQCKYSNSLGVFPGWTPASAAFHRWCGTGF